MSVNSYVPVITSRKTVLLYPAGSSFYSLGWLFSLSNVNSSTRLFYRLWMCFASLHQPCHNFLFSAFPFLLHPSFLHRAHVLSFCNSSFSSLLTFFSLVTRALFLPCLCVSFFLVHFSWPNKILPSSGWIVFKGTRFDTNCWTYAYIEKGGESI